MPLLTRILVVSNPGVFILFYPSYFNTFPPAVSLILLGSSFCGSISAKNLAYMTVLCFVTICFLMNFIEFNHLMRSFSFLVFTMTCINITY